MAKSRLFNLRLDDLARARWQAAADAEGCALAEFVKRAVEVRLTPMLGYVSFTGVKATVPVEVVQPTRPRPKLTALTGGKMFKGPDPKSGKAK